MKSWIAFIPFTLLPFPAAGNDVLVTPPNFVVHWRTDTPTSAHHYEVWVSRDGGAYALEEPANTTGEAVISIAHNETVQVAVRPVAADGTLGTLSPSSVVIGGFDTSQMTFLCQNSQALVLSAIDADTIAFGCFGGQTYQCPENTVVLTVDGETYANTTQCMLQ